MRIVQTFWTAGQDPLKHAFGWFHPEYNLMSWALSCLSLREHYDEVALYTDSEGKRILIDKLHLPYTEVNVVFDDFLCLPQHWALAKIKTYSLQTKPFLHVDGDVFVPKPFSEEILQAPLIAQNREIGTEYYRNMVNKILAYSTLKFPIFLKEGMQADSLPSYNMGIFGGQDLFFIGHYCRQVMEFMDDNHLNDTESINSKASCNVLYEQIFLALIVEYQQKKVSTLISQGFIDNGYTVGDFCDLNKYEQKAFFHILGGHKGNPHVLEMLEKAMLRNYPQKYKEILSLFPYRFRRLNPDVHFIKPPVSAERCIAQYEDFLDEQELKWESLIFDDVFQWELCCARSVPLMEEIIENKTCPHLIRHPHYVLFNIPQVWHPWATEQLKIHLNWDRKAPLNRILVMPTLGERGMKESGISEMQFKILSVLGGRSMTWDELLQEIVGEFNIENEDAQKGIKKHLNSEIRYLLQKGIVFALDK